MTDDTSPVGPLQTVESVKEFWRGFGRTIVQGSLTAIEESAKQVASISGVLIGFYSTAITLSQMRTPPIQPWKIALYLSPILLWLLGMMMALTIFWIRGYEITLESSLSSQATISQMLQSKHRRLRVSLIFLFTGIVSLIISLIIYLLGL